MVQASRKKVTQEVKLGSLDLAARAAAAPAVLDALRVDQPMFDELRAASARPESRYPVIYDLSNPWGILLAHLIHIKQICQRLDLKASAELALNKPNDAFADVQLSLFMANSLSNEPFLISYLVRVAAYQITDLSIWEGLSEHRWSEPQLEQFQTEMEKNHWIADMYHPLHAELAGGALTIDLLRTKGLGWLADLIDNGPDSSNPQLDKSLLNVVGHVVPSGWYDFERVSYARRYEAEFHGITDQARHRMFPQIVAANKPVISGGFWDGIVHHDTIVRWILPSLARFPIKAAMAQVVSDQTEIACALERFRLANQHYPKELSELSPRFMAQIPNDVLADGPYHYHPTPDGRFVLYSVGWNEKDDGGIPGKTMFDEVHGDWVWEYPPTE